MMDKNCSLPEGSTLTISDYFDSTPIASFAIDKDHVVTHWNKACAHLTGFPSDTMIGTTNHWKVFYKNKRPLLLDLIVSNTAEQEVKTYYREEIRRSAFVPGGYGVDGFFSQFGEAGLWLSFSATPLRDPEGNIVGAMEVLQDITPQKLAELSLNRTRIELETLTALSYTKIQNANKNITREDINERLHKAQAGLKNLITERTEQLAQSNVRLEEDIRQREVAEAELLRRNNELTELNTKLSMAQAQLMQSDKLASIGQLAAGVAHEINNPIGYVFSNFGTLEIYIGNLLKVLDVYEEGEKNISAPDVIQKIKKIRADVELDYLKEDIPSLMSESKEGIIRVRKIVQDLKDFSRSDTAQEWQWVNLHQGIDSTLNIVNNEIKYKADLVREYGDIPDIECFPSQINQVVMNIVVNAAHSIAGPRGKITIRTGTENNHVWIEISDTGSGIGTENLARIFDPFFTTKPIGQGTGLGLSLSYGIVHKHHGDIKVQSELGKGTTFKITLPIKQLDLVTEKKDGKGSW